MPTVKTFIVLRTSLIAFLIFLSLTSHAQHDSLILKNTNVIVGEIKSLDNEVITIHTDYSTNDFTIGWGGIKEIYCVTTFLITLKNDDQIKGTFHSADGGTKIIIIGIDGKQTETTPDSIVNLKGLKTDFWSRTHASVDLGFSLTKANNLVQYNVRSIVGYAADKWLTEIFYNDLRTKQDSVAETKRTEAGASFTYLLPKDWYLIATLSTLSNTEQALKLRFTTKAGAGKYLVHTHDSYLGVGLGLSLNKESFTNGTPERTSLEGYLGSELNLLNLGDFSLLSNLYVYPSFTESGRWRSDFKLDTKYTLPLSLYLKFGVTFNYDNRPAQPGNETDYVYVFSVGWAL